MDDHYPIGTPGVPWTDADKQRWFDEQTIKRRYDDEVLRPLHALSESFEVFQYGALPIDPGRYPLMAVRVAASKVDAPWILVTGGVHGLSLIHISEPTRPY